MIEQLTQRLEAIESAEERERLVLQIRLESLSPQVRDALQAVAIPHWFDLLFLAALLNKPPESCHAIFDSLTRLSMVESCPGRGYNVHERSRFLLLEEVGRESRDQLLQLSQRAAIHCGHYASDEEIWQIEMIYHLLIADPALGLEAFRKAAQRWHSDTDNSHELLDVVARVVREHREAGRLERQACAWSFYWDGKLDQIYNSNEAKSHFARAREFAGQDLQLDAEVALELGKFYPFEEAYSLYREALGKFQQLDDKAGIASVQFAMGSSADESNGWESARPYYEKALSLYEQIGDQKGREKSLSRLGRLHPLEPADQLFLSSLPLIDTIAAHASRRARLSKEEAEDFTSHLKIKLIENDYAMLRNYQGKSSFRTYLTLVIKRLLLDYGDNLWGKWRSSVEASRIGRIAVEWEALRVRDGFTFDEALQVLQTRHEETPSREELVELEARLPPRPLYRQRVSDERLENLSSRELAPDQDLLQRDSGGQRRKALAALQNTLDKLPSEDRLLLMMYLKGGFRVSEVARTLRLEQKPLYRRMYKIMKELRIRMEKQGFSREQVRLLLEGRDTE